MKTFRWARTFIALAALGMGLLADGGAAWAASCCSGTSSSGTFSLPKWEKASFGLDLRTRADIDMRGGEGARMGLSTWSIEESSLILGGGFRLHPDLQLGIAIPLVERRVRIGEDKARAGGLGDASIQIRYEMVDESTCYLNPLKNFSRAMLVPTFHWLLSATLPTGRALAVEHDPLGASITGRGDLVADFGFELTKILGRLGGYLQTRGGIDIPIIEEEGDVPGMHVLVGGGLLVFFRYRGFVSLNVTHSNTRRGQEDGHHQSSTDAAVGLSTRIRRFRVRLNGAALGVVQGRAVPVGYSMDVSLVRMF